MVVTGTGPDAAIHTMLALGAAAAHGLAGTVITVGEPATPGAATPDPGVEGGMPVAPAGRIPADAGSQPDDFDTFEPDAFVTPKPSVAVGEVCPQNQGRVTPARPDRATTERVNAAWKRIEVWLAEHAPATRRSLRPPAAAKTIDAAQRRMSVGFPADLVASLLSLCSAMVDGFGAADSTWWDRAFVPFASSVDGGNLLVDQRPGSHGRVGEFFNEEGVDFKEWPGSVAGLLEKTAASLETGRPFGGSYQPRVTGAGVLEWDII
jgi:cell wall assembly regulator SMI1